MAAQQSADGEGSEPTTPTAEGILMSSLSELFHQHSKGAKEADIEVHGSFRRDQRPTCNEVNKAIAMHLKAIEFLEERVLPIAEGCEEYEYAYTTEGVPYTELAVDLGEEIGAEERVETQG